MLNRFYLFISTFSRVIFFVIGFIRTLLLLIALASYLLSDGSGLYHTWLDWAGYVFAIELVVICVILTFIHLYNPEPKQKRLHHQSLSQKHPFPSR